MVVGGVHGIFYFPAGSPPINTMAAIDLHVKCLQGFHQECGCRGKRSKVKLLYIMLGRMPQYSRDTLKLPCRCCLLVLRTGRQSISSLQPHNFLICAKLTLCRTGKRGTCDHHLSMLICDNRSHYEKVASAVCT